MAGLKARSAVFALDLPAIHVFTAALFKTWMPGTRPDMTDATLRV